MTLPECIAKHTHREYKLWLDWLEQQWNKPSLTDHYLMQISQEVARVLSKKPKAITIDGFRLKFIRPKRRANTVDEKQKVITASKSAWLGATGMTKPRTKLRRPKRG